MRVMNQGADYEEDTAGEIDEVEGDEDTSAGITKIAGIPVKVLIIGGVILLVIILFVIVMGTRKKNDPVIPAADPNMGMVQTDPNVQTPPVQQSTEYYWYTIDGAYIGTSTGIYDGAVVMDNGVMKATLSANGSTSITSDTGVTHLANLDESVMVSNPVQGSTSTSQYPISGTGSYSAEQVEKLKRLGYTGDEISTAARDNLDYDSLVEAAQALREDEAIAELKRMSDHESDEFKYLLNYSIFHFPLRDFTPRNGENISYNMEDSYLVNADYEKLETYGLQLILKVKIANDTYVYMTVDPSRWETLPSTGNIVVRVTYKRYGTNDINDVYITNITEQDITSITVNPEDSTVDFSELTQLKQ